MAFRASGALIVRLAFSLPDAAFSARFSDFHGREVDFDGWTHFASSWREKRRDTLRSINDLAVGAGATDIAIKWTTLYTVGRRSQ
jgi:hypothetical protein